jgi:peptidase M42 family hydrolase
MNKPFGVSSKRVVIDVEYMVDFFRRLVEIPSPTGYTDQVVHFCGRELERLGVPFELTRRGAIRATLAGRSRGPARAMVSHLDTLGAMVKRLKENGRLELVPIGTWSARFAEGARCTIFTDQKSFRGTILPLKASGHTFNEEVDTQPVAWTNVELRVDAVAYRAEDLQRLGFNIGDYVAVDPNPEVSTSGYINSRYLDDKAGVAVMFATIKAMKEARIKPRVDTYMLFTIAEEIGVGASSVLHGAIAEMVTIDNGTVAPGQASRESGVTICMSDSAGPFDFHLTRRLIQLCEAHDIQYQRDAFRFYRSDSASAIESGNDLRTALICFGVDSSHGYERTHLHSLRSLAELSCLYLQSDILFGRDAQELGSLDGFPTQDTEDVESVEATSSAEPTAPEG